MVLRVGPLDLHVTDEAHHSVAGSWAKIAEPFLAAFVLGVTATPERLDGRGLCDAFDEMVVGPGVADLVDLGVLARQTIYADQPPDLSGVSIVNGDYDVAQIAAIVSRSAIVGDAVEHCARLCSGRPRTAYCRNIKHPELIARFV
jgi:superfamily II DNA or RNA helicase